MKRSGLLCVRGGAPTIGRRRPPDSIPVAKGRLAGFASRRKPRPRGEDVRHDLRHGDKHSLDRRSDTSVDFTDQEDPLRRALPLGLLAVLALPASAMADTF